MKNMTPFEHNTIRKAWHNDQWYFSVIDIVSVLTEQPDFKKAKSYWTTLKGRLKSEGNELVTKCDQLKMQSADGKFYKTDVANIETLLRLIQSVPSPKAEPLKLWLARVGTERIAEIQDPSQGIDRARGFWKKHGRSDKWIQQRMMGQETRNKLTDYWKDHDVKEGDEYAILTNIIHQEWTDLSVKDHKAVKNLGKSHNLRDHMNEAELILTALAELSTRQIAESMEARGLEKNKIPAKKGGQVAKNARKELESKTGKSVISDDNFLPPHTRRKKLS
ncbi:MAG: Bro-N domain-containing protein [Candidatus Peribacteraceae bacterium]|nr:Bro-N domain-containing protein [Candidatus Peribacteraceae bacterium]